MPCYFFGRIVVRAASVVFVADDKENVMRTEIPMAWQAYVDFLFITYLLE